MKLNNGISRHTSVFLVTVVLLLCSGYALYAAETAVPGMVVLNEITSTGDYDFIELFNTTDTDLVLGPEWQITDRVESRFDNDPAISFDGGTVIPAGGFLLIAPYKTSGLLARIPEEIPESALAFRSFAIGSKDEISLFFGDELVDYLSWQSDVNSIGRVRDGTDELSALLVPTPGKPNKPEEIYAGKPLLLINEVCSSGLDYVELINVSGSDLVIEAGAWRLEDSQKSDSFIIPGGTEIAAGGLLVLYPDVLRLPFSAPDNALASTVGSRFGFGNSDSVYLKYKDMIVDFFMWSDHVTSMGRYPDGSSEIDLDLFLTPGKPNRD